MHAMPAGAPPLEEAAMAARQQACPPAWRGRGRARLLWDAMAGLRRNLDNLVQLAGLLAALVRPALIRRRLARLQVLGHLDPGPLPDVAQLLVAARDQMFLALGEETRLFYRSQGIPWVFHNLRRVLSMPATMLDPLGLFAPRDALVLHVLQTFHRHPLYDFVLLRAHEGGLERLGAALAALRAGTHLHQRALESLIEDGCYHARLARDLEEFLRDPLVPPRPIPAGLVADPLLMLGMDQFKDLRGLVRYATRLDAGPWRAAGAWLAVVWNATLGRLLRVPLGRTLLDASACDADLRARHGVA